MPLAGEHFSPSEQRSAEMSERSRYQPGAPCWVDTLQPDPEAAMRFYSELFGWEFVGSGHMPGGSPGQYFVARLRGRDVAGVGSQPAAGAPPTPAWNTYIAVANAEKTVERANNAGGVILAGPLDALPAGRLAVLTDPAGARFCIWEPGLRQGAQLVNEASAWALSLLHTGDLTRAQAFYADVFGWRHEAFETAGELTLCRLPGYVGGQPEQPVPRDVVAVMVPLDRAAAPAEEPPHWSVDFWTDDTDAAASKAPALGGRVVVPPYSPPGFRTAVLSDPHGAVFSVSTLIVDR
jgi:predicted enzyme related to lactoylglutathione lyase